jgi:hypothetical protein
MSVKITLHMYNERKLEVLMDIITSAAYFNNRGIELKQEDKNLSFVFNKHCPNEYIEYLDEKYDASFDLTD